MNSNAPKLSHDVPHSSANLEAMLLSFVFQVSNWPVLWVGPPWSFHSLPNNWLCILYTRVFRTFLIMTQQHFIVSSPLRKYSWNPLTQAHVRTHTHTSARTFFLFLLHVFPLMFILTWFHLHSDNTTIILTPIIYWAFLRVCPVLSTLYTVISLNLCNHLWEENKHSYLKDTKY